MAIKPLHTFIALREGVKTKHKKDLTDAHRRATQADLYEGLTRRYLPTDDDGAELPAENKNIQINADTVLNQLVDAVSRDWDLMATIDAGNQVAFANVEVPTGEIGSNGEPVTRVILRDVPVQFLLYLARELDDVYTFVSKLPTLDPGATWTYDASVAAFVAESVRTHRTKKVLKNHVLYPHTDRHPAQVQTFTEDDVVGHWTLTRRSGALTLERKAQLLQRVDTLRLAVKEARERAATVEVDDRELSRPVFDYLFGVDN
jgi:hypothetical protein